MKKLTLTLLTIVSFTLAVNAQDEATTTGFSQGDIFVSGAFGYNSTSTGNDKDNVFTVSPRVGYFIAENIALGARIGFESNAIENAGVDTDITTFNVGAFGRYYFTPTNKFSVFGELGFDYLSTKRETGNVDVTTDGFGIGGGPGVSYFIGNNFALEAFWGALRYTTTEPDGGESTDNFNIGVDLDDITLGLVYKF